MRFGCRWGRQEGLRRRCYLRSRPPGGERAPVPRRGLSPRLLTRQVESGMLLGVQPSSGFTLRVGILGS